MNDATDTMTSTKPYLIRALYEWILDNQMTPHLVVDARYPDARLPMEFVEDGRLVLNIAPGAVRHLVIGNDWIEFSARFGGVARDVLFPTEAVIGIFTRENGQGMVFPEPIHPALAPAGPDRPVGQDIGDSAPKSPDGKGKRKGGGPTLKIVK